MFTPVSNRNSLLACSADGHARRFALFFTRRCEQSQKMKTIKLNFKKPENGWLPVEFHSDQVELSFISSNIPENPIDQLCENLILALKGVESKTFWNLEPDQLVFELAPLGENFNLIITEQGENVCSQRGNFERVLLPLYWSLKKFSTYEFNEEDWESLDPGKLKDLDRLIAVRKTAHKHI